MKKSVVVFINGAPGSGKDTLAKLLVKELAYYRIPAHTHRMAHTLKGAVHTLFGLPVSSELLTKVKDKPHPLFSHHTPREMYIGMSEVFAKVFCGEQVFGAIWANWFKTKGCKYRVILVPDTGFPLEMGPIIDAVGPDRCILVHIMRKGCDFSSDSRCAIQHHSRIGDKETFVIANRGSKIALRKDDEVFRLVQTIIAKAV